MVINLKNPIPALKGRKIIAVALAGIVVSGVGGYVLLAGGPPLNTNALSMNAPASILPANVPPPVVAPVGMEPSPVVQPGAVGPDQAPQVPPVNNQVAAPVAVAPGAVVVPPAVVPPEPVPVAAPVVAAPAPVVAPPPQAAAPKANIPPANPIAVAKLEQQQAQSAQPVKAPELGTKPATIPQAVSGAEIMAKLDAMSREMRETRAAVVSLQEKMREKKPSVVQVQVRQPIRKAVGDDHEAASAKPVSVQEIRPGAKLPNGEIVSKITADGAVTNTGRLIRWGDQ